MTLHEICSEIMQIEKGLLNGEIEFRYDNLMSALKVGHPAEILDDILAEIGWRVFDGKDVELNRVKAWVEKLESFSEDFEIEELSAPIEHCKQYIKEQEK